MALGDENLKWRNVETEAAFDTDYGKYVGSKGIDSIYRGKDGKIYIVESKASGSKDSASCKAGSLCTSNDGKQMSQEWLYNDRLKNAG
ncbi:hypothetical protein [Neptunomonas antarctica]|uniref:Uncharacterized protein n=1 Tax=Neptunomonas antarctica TaxID=619304 RepID=A0A1N7IUH1_9GAMM|nr:hypothetical protein [Neptunomonas antarctica]SIS40742.1 hypothetical protein SAMN05421760_101151 [Neptunomonas antarctica]